MKVAPFLQDVTGAGRTLLRLGLAGIILFSAAMAVLHLLNWKNMPRHVSTFAHQAGGWFWDAGLLGLGGGTLALVAGLRRVLAVAGPAAWAFRGLQAAGLCIVLMVPFPTDRNLHAAYASTVGGYVHDTFAVLSTFFICWSMLLMVAAARVDPAWRGVPGRSWAWPAATILCALAWMGGDLTSFWQVASFVQRGVVILMLAWLLALGARAQSLETHASGMPQPVRPPRPTR